MRSFIMTMAALVITSAGSAGASVVHPMTSPSARRGAARRCRTIPAPWGPVAQVWKGVGAIGDLGTPRDDDVFPFFGHVDQGEAALLEGTVFRVLGSSELSSWTAGALDQAWTGGYNPLAVYDDHSSSRSFGGQASRYVELESANWETLLDSAKYGIDAVTRPS